MLAKNLSGGAKRELCVAIALSVAEAAKQTQSHHPSLILLDEPTAGVDPFAKRKLWEAVEDVMKSNRGAAVVVTSHDVFECKRSAPPSVYSAKASSFFAVTLPTSKKSFPKTRVRYPR